MDSLLKFLSNTLVIQIMISLLGIITISIFQKIIKNTILNRTKDNNSKYRIRKLISIIGFLIQIVLISIVFKDKLGGITVAFGVAGAGIAFALQELIVSLAGWIALSFGDFYKVGDKFS